MKKLFLIGLLFIAILAVEFAAYIYWATATFTFREVKKLTGASEVRVLDETHTNWDWYGKAEIDEKAGRAFLQRSQWPRGFQRKVALTGFDIPDRPLDCSRCFYRIEIDPHDRKYHPWRFTLYVLSPDFRVLEVYEQFGR
ncbi:MAG: hypothetical protein JSS87_14925 [Acidobacteria bacterium]|nr:hypothetical protein [Acidobacteriota bacterium]